MPVRMKDIAQDLGISIVTVSKVLRDHPDISAETRDRVLKRMKEVNYRPNLAARALVTGRTYSVGLVVPDLVHPFFGEVAKGMSRVLRKKGYNLVISSSYNGAPPTFAGDTGGSCREWCPRATATAPGVPGKPGYEDCFASHAETNAVKRAPHVDSLTTTRLYVSRMPCYRCAVEIASARVTHGLIEVVAPVSMETNTQHGDVNHSVEFLAKCDVRVRLV